MNKPPTEMTGHGNLPATEAEERLFYISYFRLHDIEWEIVEPILIQDANRAMQVKIAHGPFRLPAAAMEQPKTKAGGAYFEVPDEVVELPHGLYCEVAFNVTDDGPDKSADWIDWWDEYTTTAEALAAATSLSMKQRIAPVRVGEYVRAEEPDKVYGQQYRFRSFAGAPATVTADMQEDIRRSVDVVMNRHLRPQVCVALNWYDHSKGVDNGPDRLVSLWIALEALVGKSNGRYLDLTVADVLARGEYGLNLPARELASALGLTEMRRLRNRIVHEGYRPSSWDLTVSNGRDLPQILDDVISELLRFEMGLSPGGLLQRHITDTRAKSSQT